MTSRRAPSARAALLVVVAVLMIAPLVLSTFRLELLAEVLIFALAAASLDLLVGYAGMPSLGHAAFVGLGAYVAGLGAIHWTGDALLGVSPIVFYNGLTSGLLGIGDITSGLVKSVMFGVVIGLSSCQFGLGVKGGAPGVGKAVNATVVASAAGVFILDYIVSFTL